MKYLLVAFLSTLALASAQEIKVRNISYGGSGCPQGTVSKSISNDRSVFTIIYDQFVASIGKDSPITDSRKNCQLNLDLEIPKGWRFSILGSDYRGYAQLDRGVSGSHLTTYYFAGNSQQVTTKADFQGPVAKDYIIHDNTGLLTWSPCGGQFNLNANSQVRLVSSTSNGSGQLTNDSTDGKFSCSLRLGWSRC